jgi:hypothetical protein
MLDVQTSREAVDTARWRTPHCGLHQRVNARFVELLGR